MFGASISVVIPALNEAENLPHVLPRIPKWVDEVLLVDGNSTDNTVEVARRVSPDIRIIRQHGRGKGAALRSGFAAATGDIIVMLDADGSTDPREIPAFVGALVAGADFAKGSRFLCGGGTADMSYYRRLGTIALVWLANLLFGTRFSDITYGYNAVWRWHGYALALELDGWAQEIISNIRATRFGLRVAEVSCFEHKRLAGEAKLRAFDAGWTILKAILAERLRREARLIERTQLHSQSRRLHLVETRPGYDAAPVHEDSVEATPPTFRGSGDAYTAGLVSEAEYGSSSLQNQ
ncbi:MAG: glycosyltransferase family 2 protein [Chloroflexota bacterium]|nr:MAG: glycosyltransferase family 2 protein [Chloroflexota bacterium]